MFSNRVGLLEAEMKTKLEERIKAMRAIIKSYENKKNKNGDENKNGGTKTPPANQ